MLNKLISSLPSKVDGVLIVSGIIIERAEETVAALNEAGFRVIDDRRENGWYAAAVKRG